MKNQIARAVAANPKTFREPAPYPTGLNAGIACEAIRPESGFEAAFRQLECAGKDLEDALGALCNRLIPVMTPPCPTNSRDLAKEGPGGMQSEFVARLESAARCLQNNTQLVREMLDRVQV